jgi:hypothetical protein
LYDVELYRLTFFECFVAVHLDCGKVNEYVSAFFRLDESVTLLSIEPFNFTLHVLNIPFIVRMTCEIADSA